MSVRTLKLEMKRGLAIVKECTEIPLKEDVLFHTNEYTFYCNPTTFDKLVRYRNIEDSDEANKKLENYFLHEVIASPNLTQFCFDFDRAVDEMKSQLILGKEGDTSSYNEDWEPERDENILRQFNKNKLERKSAGLGELKIYTSPNNFYKAMVDIENESVEFLQFEEAMSALKQKNVIAEHININRRPMYIAHKLLTLIMFIRDQTKNRKWGE